MVYLQRYMLIEQWGLPAEHDWDKISDAQLVEFATDMLGKALEYRLGYHGNFSRVDQEGVIWDKYRIPDYRFKGKHSAIVDQVAHAVVHLVN
jgi:hypothetical protein